MSDLLLPTGVTPSNLHLREDDRVGLVTSDLFHIADRLKELSPRLKIIQLQRGDSFGYVIMESCADGVERMVCRLKKNELDSRLLDRLQYAYSVDLHERIAIIDKERDAWERQQEDDAQEELYERMGGKMWVELEKCGFIDSRGTSYPKMNRTARRARGIR